jgi:hypothetical protein
VTAPQTTPALGYVGDYLASLAAHPPATSDAHKTAAATLLRHAATEARNLFGHEQQVEARVSTLTRLATTHILLADILVADLARAADL